MKHLLVIALLVIAFFLLRKDKGGKGSGEPGNPGNAVSQLKAELENSLGQSKNRSYQNFESDFEQGLPKEYIPDTPDHFSDYEKFAEDHRFRLKKLHRHFEEEKKALNNSKDASPERMDELREKQEKAKEEFLAKYQVLKKEFLERKKEEDSSRAKGLR